MTNKTTVNLTVRAADFNQHESLFDGYEIDDSALPNLICLTYEDIKYANLEFESTLQALRIPYEKAWSSCAEFEGGYECCRVLATGSIEVNVLDDSERFSVSLSDAIDAYQRGCISAFLQDAKRYRWDMCWNTQELILQAREKAEQALKAIEQPSLDALTTTFCEQTDKLAEPDLSAADIINEGPDAQICFLLNNGYLTEETKQHSFSEFLIDANQPEEQYRVIAISTGHLTEEDISALEIAADDSDENMVLERDTGFFIKLYEDDEDGGINLRHGHSDTIQTLIQWCHAAGFRMIEFDCDAPTLPHFPVFND